MKIQQYHWDMYFHLVAEIGYILGLLVSTTIKLTQFSPITIKAIFTQAQICNKHYSSSQ